MARWLGDIRQFFPSSIVRVMQQDALDRLGLQQMLFEPELLATIEADVHLVSTLISLKNVIPSKTKDTARQVVDRVVQDLRRRQTHNAHPPGLYSPTPEEKAEFMLVP